MAQILIIDDDESVRRSLGRILEREGYEVLAAEDGARGMRLLEEHRPALVVTDVFMPEMDGIEILMGVREADASIPIVVVSGGGQTPAAHVLEDASQLGADAILRKPFERTEVLETVPRLLDERGA